MDRSRLAWLLANWCTGNPKCFTCKIKALYRRTGRELFPVLSSIQNIGYDLGENGRTAEWYRSNHRTPWVAASSVIGDFAIVSVVSRDVAPGADTAMREAARLNVDEPEFPRTVPAIRVP